MAAPYVFYGVAGFGLVAAGAVWRFGAVLLPMSALATLAGLFALYLNDHKGFIRRRQMRRAYEARRNFTSIETTIVLVLIMANVFASAYAILQ